MSPSLRFLCVFDFRTVLGGAQSRVLPKTVVEVGNGLEAAFKRRLADTAGWIEKEKFFDYFDANPPHILGEGHAGGFLEKLAKVLGAEVDVLGNITQGNGIGEMRFNVFPGMRDGIRFALVICHRPPFNVFGQMILQQNQKGCRSCKLPGPNHGCL